jgi:cytochrome c oxidase assembly factor CtaG
MIWDTTALADQQFGGLLMMIPGKLVYFLALTIIFFRWFNTQDQPPIPGQPPLR